MKPTDKENYIPIFEELERKIQTIEALSKDDKMHITALISNQIQIQLGNVNPIVSGDDTFYGFELTKTIY